MITLSATHTRLLISSCGRCLLQPTFAQPGALISRPSYRDESRCSGHQQDSLPTVLPAPSKAVSGLKTTMQRGTPLGSERHYSWQADGWRSEASSPPQRESAGRPNFDAAGTADSAGEEKPAASAEAQNRAPKKRPRLTTAPGLAAPSRGGETVSRVGTSYEPALRHNPTSETGSGDSAGAAARRDRDRSTRCQLTHPFRRGALL